MGYDRYCFNLRDLMLKELDNITLSEVNEYIKTMTDRIALVNSHSISNYDVTKPGSEQCHGKYLTEMTRINFDMEKEFEFIESTASKDDNLQKNYDELKKKL